VFDRAEEQCWRGGVREESFRQEREGTPQGRGTLALVYLVGRAREQTDVSAFVRCRSCARTSYPISRVIRFFSSSLPIVYVLLPQIVATGHGYLRDQRSNRARTSLHKRRRTVAKHLKTDTGRFGLPPPAPRLTLP